MLNIAITGCSGFIGKKLCFILKNINNFNIIEIYRKDLNNLNEIFKNQQINIFIHVIHDFKNAENNIKILEQINNCFKKNYYPNKFMYFSSWVTLFKIGINDSYYVSKINCEKYIKNNIKNYLIYRPPLVCCKDNIWTNKYILYLSYGYYIHVNELIFIIIDDIENNKNTNIILNTKSHFYNKNIFPNVLNKNISFLQKTIGFITQGYKL